MFPEVCQIIETVDPDLKKKKKKKSIFIYLNFGILSIREIWKGNLYLTENRLSWNKMCCALDNYNYMCHTCSKKFLNLSFNLAVIDQISNFHDIAPNFTFSQKS